MTITTHHSLRALQFIKSRLTCCNTDKDAIIPAYRASLASHDNKLWAVWVDSKDAYLCTVKLESNAQVQFPHNQWKTPSPVAGSSSFCDVGDKIYLVHAEKSGKLVQQEYLGQTDQLVPVSGRRVYEPGQYQSFYR